MSAEATIREGGCLCGAVRFSAKVSTREVHGCHCEMCRRWTGSAFLAVTVPVREITWTGSEAIRRYQSSDWAERANCKECGAPLYYHVTTEGPFSASLELSLGLFDDPSGLTLSKEIFIDHKPQAFAYSGDHPRLTRKETLAGFGISEEDN
ncbi:GFA family protein [Natronohydrobacter thiooxidans]|jgi:hypothetical protein|uniref:GFA family protein n=1 Tax=Natronohydrobacter thiooxidans TaxID=87172 RepID=UPI0008FF2528|nr:GFA family protein [Natronohydrobacter thiooxidans]